MNVISELESLKPIVKQQIAELNRGAAEEPNGQRGMSAANGASSRMDQLAASPHMVQVYPLFDFGFILTFLCHLLEKGAMYCKLIGTFCKYCFILFFM